MTAELYVKIGKVTALLSFLLGTVIFILYFLPFSSNLFEIGIFYTAIAGTINTVILIAILLKANKDNENRSILLRTCGIMLLNIPCVFLYIYIILEQTIKIHITP